MSAVEQAIVDAIAAEVAKLPVELGMGVVALVKRIAGAQDPADALGRAAQVLAHEKAADAALDAAFEAKRHVAGTGE